MDNTADSRAAALDRLARRLVARGPYRFAVAASDDEQRVAFRLRFEAVVGRGFAGAADLPGRLERDDYDHHAVHVVGWLGDVAVSAGRIVLPPGPLPTEDACGIVVGPVGQVVDVGRMVVARPYQDPHHQTFLALLGRLYLEVRNRGFSVACGMMSPQVRALARQLGLRLEVLGEERMYWNQRRAPVRFELQHNAPTLVQRWAEDPGRRPPSAPGQHEAGIGAPKAE